MRRGTHRSSHPREKESTMRLIPTVIPRFEPRASSRDTARTECSTWYTPGSRVYTMVYPGWCSTGIYTQVYTPGRYTQGGILGYVHPMVHPVVYWAMYTPMVHPVVHPEVHSHEAQRALLSPMEERIMWRREPSFLPILWEKQEGNEAQSPPFPPWLMS